MYHALAKKIPNYNCGTYIKNDLATYIEMHREKYKVRVTDLNAIPTCVNKGIIDECNILLHIILTESFCQQCSIFLL